MIWCQRHDRELGSPRFSFTPATPGASGEVVYDCGCHWAWFPRDPVDGLVSYRRVTLDGPETTAGSAG